MDGIANDADFDVPPETSATLFDILCQHVEGDAWMIMKSVTDCNGFEAWQKLNKKYNPVTFARGLRLLTNVVNPGRIKNCNEVDAGIILWEEKASQLDSQFDEKLRDSLKMAILIPMPCRMEFRTP